MPICIWYTINITNDWTFIASSQLDYNTDISKGISNLVLCQNQIRVLSNRYKKPQSIGQWNMKVNDYIQSPGSEFIPINYNMEWLIKPAYVNWTYTF